MEHYTTRCCSDHLTAPHINKYYIRTERKRLREKKENVLNQNSLGSYADRKIIYCIIDAAGANFKIITHIFTVL